MSQREHGGYCTVFDCEPNKCPDEAACVVFGASPSSVDMCENSSGTNPSQRSFCMKKCDSSSDCRTADGYFCLQPEGTAVNVDGTGKVCMLPQSELELPEDRPGDVCVGVSGQGGSAGTGGTAGTGAGGEGGEAGMSGGG